MHPRPTRRELLAGTVHVLAVLPAIAVAGCKGRVSCADTSGLAPADAKARSDQNYLDTTPDPNKACSSCSHWIASAEGCGGCAVLKGPINANGTCNLFVRK
jgi:hypothetical protein